MITQADIDMIDTSYFDTIAIKPYTLVLRSRNTGHYWSLLERVSCGHRTFLISHKHHEQDPYHFQNIRGRADGGVGAAVEYIMHHDADYLERIRKKEERRERGRKRKMEELQQERVRQERVRQECMRQECVRQEMPESQ